MSLIQQRCWVLPKQKAWLCSPLLMLGNSCSHKLPQQPLARSAPSRNADGQHPAFGLYEPMGVHKPTSKRTPFLSLSHQNPSSWMRPSMTTRAVTLFRGQMARATWRVANCFLLMEHVVRGGETPRAPLPSSPRGMTQALQPSSLDSGSSSLYVQRKICSFRTKVACKRFELDLEKL